LAATSVVAGDGRSFVEGVPVLKCRLALDAIAPRYGGAIGGSYRTDWTTAFPFSMAAAFDGHAPDWRASASIRRSIQ
jgi:hypothetical protein